MKKILLTLSVCILFLVSCETKQTVINTGVSDPVFDGNIMEYLRSDDFNWDLTVQMIERAGLEDLFEGSDQDHPEITFFGVTSYSILRYLWDNDLETITDLSMEECRDLLYMHIVDGKHLKESFKFRDLDYYIFEDDQTGYTDLETLGGNTIRVYLEREDYGGVPQAGAIIMKLYSMEKQLNIPLASPDIQPDNGVVHALDYSYVLGLL